MSKARSELSVTQAIGMTGADIERRWKLVGFGADDFKRISEMRDLLIGRIDDYTDRFFQNISTVPEGQGLLANREVFSQAKSLKRAHLAAMLDGDYTDSYVAQRLKLALIYAQAELPLSLFIS